MVSSFDTAAWYLLTYSGTSTLELWKEAVTESFKELEQTLGPGGARKTINKMVAFYCMEIGPSYKGRQAISKFRRCHTWPDFRTADRWWADEWKQRKAFDTTVGEVRARVLSAAPSLAPADIDHDNDAREALSVLMAEAERRHGTENLATCESAFRALISIYGGTPILALWEKGYDGRSEYSRFLRDRQAIPSLLSSYFVERALVAEFGESLVGMKLEGVA